MPQLQCASHCLIRCIYGFALVGITAEPWIEQGQYVKGEDGSCDEAPDNNCCERQRDGAQMRGLFLIHLNLSCDRQTVASMALETMATGLRISCATALVASLGFIPMAL